MSGTVRGLALAVVLWAGLVQGATWVVCPTDCRYTTLGEAIAAAAPGDTILVRPGTYAGEVWVKKPLDIRGDGGEPPVIAGDLYVLGTSQVALRGLVVRGGGIHIEDTSGVLIADCVVEGPRGILVRSSSATIRATTVTGAEGHGILITLGARALVAGCRVSGAKGDGIHVGASLADLRDNEVSDNGGYGIWGDAHATVTGHATLAAVRGNAAGAVGGTARALDRDPPAAPPGLTVSPTGWTAGPASVSWIAPPDLSGIAAVWYKIGSLPHSPDDGTRTVGNPFLIAAPPEGKHTLYVWLEDHAGNRSEKAFAEATLRADRTPPSGKVSLDNGNRHVFSSVVTLTVSAADLAGSESGSGVTSLRLSNDGKTWSAWQPFATSVRWDLAGSGGSAAPGGKTVFVELRDAAGNVGRATADLTLVQSVATAEPIPCLAFTRLGNRLAYGSLSGAIYVLEPATGETLLTLRGHTGAVYGLAFSPDGKLLASGSIDNTVRIWDMATGKEARVLRGHTGGVWAVAFSPDGKTIASGSSDGTIRLWAVPSGRALRTLSGHTGAVRSVAFSPDGKTLASGADDRSVRVWDVSTGKPKHTLSGHGGAVRSVAYAPEGALLASGGADGKVIVWDTAAAERVRELRLARGGARAVAFSPDGKSVACGTTTGAVVVWDVATGKERYALSGHDAPLNALAYSPDRRTLASAGDDNVIRLWVVGP